MARAPSVELRYVSDTLDRLSFAGMDQNPKGIRDILFCLIEKVERMERALSAYTHINGAPKYAPDGTMLDDKGNRSIFGDVDQ